jgi:hypothetical protein
MKKISINSIEALSFKTFGSSLRVDFEKKLYREAFVDYITISLYERSKPKLESRIPNHDTSNINRHHQNTYLIISGI